MRTKCLGYMLILSVMMVNLSGCTADINSIRQFVENAASYLPAEKPPSSAGKATEQHTSSAGKDSEQPPSSAESVAEQPLENVHVITDEELLQKAEASRAVNPWGETQSLSVATEWAGMDFIPPEEEITLDSGRVIQLTTYRYMTRTIEALYKGEDFELVVRKSNDAEGTALAGDKDPYPSERDENIEGLYVHCLGEGDAVNLAYFDASGEHFSITFHSAKEGEGLTKKDLSEMIKKITVQADPA